MPRAVTVYVVFYAAIACTSPYLAPYYRSLGLSLNEVGLLASLAAAISFVAGPAWGALHDRYPHARWLIPLACVAAAAGSSVLGLAGTSWWIVVAVVVYAGGVAGIGPMIDVRALDLLGENRSRYGFVRSWGSLSFLLAAPVIGLVIAATRPSGFLLAYVPLLLLTALAVLWLPPRKSVVRSGGLLRAPGRVLTDRTLAIFFAGALVAWVAMVGQSQFMTVYLQQLGAPPEEIGLMMSVGAAFEVPTMLAFPRLTARFGLERLIVFGAAIVVVRQLSGALFTEPALLIAFTGFQGVGYALLLVGGVAFVSTHAPKGAAATAQGVLSAISWGLASIIGSGLGGAIAGQIGLRAMFGSCAALGAVATVVIAVAVLPVARRATANLRGVPEPSQAEVTGPDASTGVGPLPEPFEP